LNEHATSLACTRTGPPAPAGWDRRYGRRLPRSTPVTLGGHGTTERDRLYRAGRLEGLWWAPDLPAAQVLHVGPYATEGPTIAAVHEHIHGLGGTLTGKHHEIYLSDPRRSAPERLRTIVRQPYAVGA